MVWLFNRVWWMCFSISSGEDKKRWSRKNSNAIFFLIVSNFFSALSKRNKELNLSNEKWFILHFLHALRLRKKRDEEKKLMKWTENATENSNGTPKNHGNYDDLALLFPDLAIQFYVLSSVEYNCDHRSFANQWEGEKKRLIYATHLLRNSDCSKWTNGFWSIGRHATEKNLIS